MYLINYFLCDSCNETVGIKADHVISEHICKNCNIPTLHTTTIEFNDEGIKVKEHLANGTVVECGPTPIPDILKPKPIITCPYCSSTDCKKLGAISRGVSFGLLGFASSKIGKNFHCNNCSSDF